MVELEDYEGLRNTSSENLQKEGLSDAQYDYMNELKVSTQEWNNLSTLQQLEQIRVIEERFDELGVPFDLSTVFESVFGKEMAETYNRKEMLSGLLESNIEAPSDLEQIGKISDLLSECKELRYENWEQLSSEEKTELLNSLECKIADIECRPPCPVCFEPMDEGTYGGYNEYRKDITLNENLLSNDYGVYCELLDTLVHEGRHAYPDYNLHIQEVHPRHSEVESWRDTWGDGRWQYCNDCRTELGARLYHQQSIEIDARNFAGDVLESLMQKQIG
jgi:hypothetical protein